MSEVEKALDRSAAYSLNARLFLWRNFEGLYNRDAYLYVYIRSEDIPT